MKWLLTVAVAVSGACAVAALPDEKENKGQKITLEIEGVV